MNWLINLLNIIFVVIVLDIAVRRVHSMRPQQTFLALVAMGMAFLFVNIEKFASFKGLGIEAQVQKVDNAVKEAYAAVKDLKNLGLALSEPIVNTLAVSGNLLLTMRMQAKMTSVANIEKMLKRLGASQKEIDRACSSIYLLTTQQHVKRILYRLRDTNPEKPALFKELETGAMDDWDEAKLRAYITENKLIEDQETKEWFEDLKFFLQTKKLRRPDKWDN